MDKPLFSWLRLPAPPAWWLDELRNRVVLLLNHVLQQEPEARARLRRQAGKRITVRAPTLLPAAWQAAVGDALRLQVTAAGLLALARDAAPDDLTLTLQEPSPLALLQRALAADKPAVAIAGDVQLAAEVAWLIDHVRWDVEEDLARLVGDALAHTWVQAGRRLAQALRAHVLPRVRALAERAARAPARGPAPSSGAGA